MIQQTLILLKPDAVERGLTDEIISRYEKAGLRVVKQKKLVAPSEIVEKHYPMDEDYLKSIGEKSAQAGEKIADTLEQGKLVVTWLRAFIASGPLIAMILEGEDAVARVREITGFTDPAQAKKGTIRGDLGVDSILKANSDHRPVYNLIHASGNEEEAEKEIKLWFGEE